MSNPKPSKNIPVKVEYTSIPVPIPDDFLAPVEDPSTIQVQKIDFANSILPEYTDCYAVILDNVLSPEECAQLLHMAEASAGGHQNDNSTPEVENNGWKVAMVNVGGGYEVAVPDYRNSDRIIWDEGIVMNRLWKRILQGEGMKEYLLKLKGKEYESVLGSAGKWKNHESEYGWVPTEQGINERMRFLKYGAGQFFRQHCDGSYVTPDGKQVSYFTMHLYLNDSAQALGIPEPGKRSKDPRLVDSAAGPAKILRGGATTFHDRRGGSKRIDVDPKVGRVLVFQHRRLEHSGDDVKAGIKYTLRSDIMYEREPQKK